jgi:integrase
MTTEGSARPRRTRGEGSLYYDEATNFWIASLYVNGKKVRRKSRTRAGAVAKLNELKAVQSSGQAAPDMAMTVAQWLDLWVAGIERSDRAPSTKGNYSLTVKAHLKPHLGRHLLSRLSVRHVDAMLNKLEDDGMRPGTRGQVRTILSCALKEAMRQERVTRNIAALSTPPKPSDTRLDDALDADELQAVLAATKGDRLAGLAWLVLGTGLRKGEATALTWTDLDLDGEIPTVSIRKAKTPSGVRQLALPVAVVEALRSHRARQAAERLAAGPAWEEPSLVFTTRKGGRMQDRWTLDWWHGLTERAGVGRRRFHASRHTAAIHMLNNGVRLEVVSHTLGHAGLSITADVYARVQLRNQAHAATVMDAVLTGTAGPEAVAE